MPLPDDWRKKCFSHCLKSHCLSYLTCTPHQISRKSYPGGLIILILSIQRFVRIFTLVIWNISWKFYHIEKSRGNLIFHSNFAFWSLPPGSAKVSLWTRNFDFQVDQKGRLGKGLSYFYKVRFYVLTQFSWHNRFNKTHEYTRYLKDVSWKSLNLYSNELQQMGKLNVGKIWKLSLTWRVNCIIYGWNWLTPFLVPEKIIYLIMTYKGTKKHGFISPKNLVKGTTILEMFYDVEAATCTIFRGATGCCLGWKLIFHPW